MNENLELYQHIYQDAEMACYTLQTLLKDLKDKDNKIKKLLEDILKEYYTFREKAKDELQNNNITLEPTGAMSKMMAGMGIKREVKNDNSDSSMADMLIQGVSMGSINTEKKINEFEKDLDKNTLNFAKDFLKFQQKTIDDLKNYL